MRRQITLTNILLAIIAFCLVFNLLVNGNLVSKAYAGTRQQASAPIDVRIVEIDQRVNNGYGKLPINITEVRGGNDPLPVVIKKDY